METERAAPPEERGVKAHEQRLAIEEEISGQIESARNARKIEGGLSPCGSRRRKKGPLKVSTLITNRAVGIGVEKIRYGVARKEMRNL